MLPLDIIFFVLYPILVFDQRSSFLFKLISNILGLLLFFPDALADLFQFCIFLPKKVQLDSELLPHCLVLLDDSIVVKSDRRNVCLNLFGGILQCF